MTGSDRCGRPTSTTGRPCRGFRAAGGFTPAPACASHLTEEERAAWQREKDAVTVAVFGPLLAWPAEPACWSWPVPGDLDKFTRAAVADHSPDAAAVLLRSDEARGSTALNAWHAGRCAICGRVDGGELVTDHDHDTGLIRGLLCRSCNTREGLNAAGSFAAYRERHPAAILGVRARYYDPYAREYARPVADPS